MLVIRPRPFDKLRMRATSNGRRLRELAVETLILSLSKDEGFVAPSYFRSALVASRSALNSEPACHSGQVFELARSAPIS